VIVGLLLAFGGNAPLSLNRIVYFVPVLNLFRVPARHLMEVHFAVAMLAGRGLTVLVEYRQESKEALHRIHCCRRFCADLFDCDVGTAC
jgi:hypothetical protein